MSRSRSLLALVVLLLLSAPVTAQDRRYAARVELHPIQTLTLSDEQFLSGDTGGGKLVTVSGQLRIAQGTGRLPVVVLVHGSGGMGANIELALRRAMSSATPTRVSSGIRMWGTTRSRRGPPSSLCATS